MKTSSLGDVVHTLPALTDAHLEAEGRVSFDWVVEEAFAPVAGLHAAVSGVIPVAVRRWRKRPFSSDNWSEFRGFLRLLGRRTYDLVIDAQGLLKSALLASCSGAPVVGFDWHSAREPLASRLYGRRLAIPRDGHAIERTRRLFAEALGYPLPAGRPDYGVARPSLPQASGGLRILLIHGSSWPSKLWPEAHWRQLAELVTREGHEVLLPWGNVAERTRAESIAGGLAGVTLLPRLGLGDLMAQLADVSGAVCVDTGLGHLLAALEVPAVSLYGPTSATLTGTLGARQAHLVATDQCSPCLKRVCRHVGASGGTSPCFNRLTPELAWQTLEGLLGRRSSGVCS